MDPELFERMARRVVGHEDDPVALTKGEVKALMQAFAEAADRNVVLEQQLNKDGEDLLTKDERRLLENAGAELRANHWDHMTQLEQVQWLQVKWREAEQKASYLEQCGVNNTALTEANERLHHNWERANAEIVRLNVQIEARDRALATQIEAYQKLEKKLTRLTGLAEDMVEEAASAQ